MFDSTTHVSAWRPKKWAVNSGLDTWNQTGNELQEGYNFASSPSTLPNITRHWWKASISRGLQAVMCNGLRYYQVWTWEFVATHWPVQLLFPGLRGPQSTKSVTVIDQFSLFVNSWGVHGILCFYRNCGKGIRRGFAHKEKRNWRCATMKNRENSDTQRKERQ